MKTQSSSNAAFWVIVVVVVLAILADSNSSSNSQGPSNEEAYSRSDPITALMQGTLEQGGEREVPRLLLPDPFESSSSNYEPYTPSAYEKFIERLSNVMTVVLACFGLLVSINVVILLVRFSQRLWHGKLPFKVTEAVADTAVASSESLQLRLARRFGVMLGRG